MTERRSVVPRDSGPERGLRLAELLAAVSLATDLAHDVPAESALRDALLSVELARIAGWSEPDISDAYYLALLYHIGCTAAVAAQSRLGAGDDVNVRRWMAEADYTNQPQMMGIAVTKIMPRWRPADLAPAMAALASAGRDLPEALASTAEVACRLSERLGASPGVTESLGHAYARWDGKVFPLLPSSEALSASARLVHLVHVAQVYQLAGGAEAADDVVRRRSGAEFDPTLAALWLKHSPDLLRNVAFESVWDLVLDAEPEPHRHVGPAHLDQVSRPSPTLSTWRRLSRLGIQPGLRGWPRVPHAEQALTQTQQPRSGALRWSMTSAWSASPTGSGPSAGRSTHPSGSGFVSTPATASASSAWPRRCANRRLWRASITSGSTAPAIAADCPPQPFLYSPAYSLSPRSTSR